MVLKTPRLEIKTCHFSQVEHISDMNDTDHMNDLVLGLEKAGGVLQETKNKIEKILLKTYYIYLR